MIELRDALDQSRAAINSVLVLPPFADVALCLWAAATHLGRASDYYPRLALVAATENAGKTTALRALARLGHKAKLVSNITAAGLFRFLDATVRDGSTVLLDEADNLALEDTGFLRAIINAGVEQDGGVVIRCVGDDHVPVEFDVRGWIALAQVGMVEPATVRSRCILLNLARAATPPPRRLDALVGKEFEVIGERLRLAVDLNAKEIVARDPELPRALTNRAADKWRRLIALADVAGGEWPELARRAATALGAADGEPETWTTASLMLDALEAALSGTKQPQVALVDIQRHALTAGVANAENPVAVGRLLGGLGLVSERKRGAAGRARMYHREAVVETLARNGRSMEPPA